MIYQKNVCYYLENSEASKLGLTQWNLSSFEFKFDDTRPYKNKIGPNKKNESGMEPFW
jgi:hypothetical protein